MTIGFNIWMICLILNWFFFDLSWMLQLSDFVWTPRSSAWVVFNNFLLIDTTDRNKISSDQKRLFSDVSLYPLSFFANTPFNCDNSYMFFLVVEMRKSLDQKKAFKGTIVNWAMPFLHLGSITLTVFETS